MRNKSSVVLLLFWIIFSGTLLFPQQKKFVRVDGKNIVDLEGEPLLLKGIGIGNWLLPEGYMFNFKNTNSPVLIEKMIKELIGPAQARKFWNEFRSVYITQDDIRLIKQAGFNSIRLAFSFRLFADEDRPEIFYEEGFFHLDNIIEWCKKESLWVILDMHAAPGGQTGDNIDDSYGYPFLFVDRESQSLTIDIWKRIASRYRDESIVIGYDLLNEPIAHYFDTENLNPALEPFFKELVSEIRMIDTNHIVFIGGAQWNSNFSVFGEPFDKNSVYTFHKYWTAPSVDVIQSYIDFRNNYNIPIWMGESGENENDWIKEFRQTLESNNIGWSFWPYKKMDSSRGVVSFNMPGNWGVIQEYAESDRKTFEQIRANRPDREHAKRILYELLENIKLKNCRVNKEYINALGLDIN